MIVDITPQNFHTELLEASQQKGVLLYFYAPQMAECAEMTPLLESLVGANNPHLTLAKLDMNDPQLQPLAGQLGLRALPALVKFYQGRPDDKTFLEGPQSETILREYFELLAPKPELLLLAQAKELLGEEKASEALPLLQQALALAPNAAEIKLVLAQVALDLNQVELAEAQLTSIAMVDQNGDYHALCARLELAKQAADSPELRLLEERHQADPLDVATAQELAVQYSQLGRQEEALALLYPLLQRDLSAGEVKKIFLDILATLGTSAVASTWRRKLYSLLY